MGFGEKVAGFLLLGAGVLLHMAAWPWALTLGLVLAATFSLIFPGRVLCPVLFCLPAVWLWGLAAEGPVPRSAITGLAVLSFGAMAARRRLLSEWESLAHVTLPFMAKRKLYRMCGLAFPLGVFVLWGPGIYRATLGVFAVAILAAEVLRKRRAWFDSRFRRFFSGVSKERERENVSGTAWYLWGASIASLCPGVAGPAAVVMMTLGDAWAVMVGKRWGRRRLLGEKTVSGTAACFAVAFVSGFVFANMVFPAPARVLPYLAGGAVTAVSEVITPGRWDNLTVAPLAGLAIWWAGVFF